jgi:colicin import membrane protein
MGRLPNGQQLSLGALDGRGELSVDLAATVPSSMLTGPNPPTRMSVWIQQTQIGSVTLAPVAFAQAAEILEREEAAWRAVDVALCREGRVDNACAAVMAFLAAHPNGNHAAEAKRLIELNASRPKSSAQIAADASTLKAEADKKKAEEAAKKKAEEAAKKKAEAEAAAAKAAAEAAKVARESAAKAAKEAAAQACNRQCATTCKHEKVCTTKCAQEACQ